MSSRIVALRMEHIDKSFAGIPVLKDVSFEIYKGEVHALMGENGAGKSTLIKILTGIYSKDNGRILLNGQEVKITSRTDAKRNGISVIYQELSLIPTLSVTQNILLGDEICKKGIVDGKAMRKRVMEIMDTYSLHVNPDAIVETLSIAQRQMVEILKALAFQSSVIIMDEPTSSLSTSETELLLKIIRSLSRQGVSILYISHRLEEVYEVSDRLTVLKDGVKVAVLEKEEIEPKKVIELMIGKGIDETVVEAEMRKSCQPVVLELKNLSKKDVFEDVSFSAHRGEVLGISGLVGSGRTELLRCIYGIDRLDNGQVIFEGQVMKSNVSHNIREGFGFVPEDRRKQGFVPMLSVCKNIALVSYDNIKRRGPFVAGKEEMSLSRQGIEKLDIRPNNPHLPVGNLSGGNQQKVVLGKWMVRDLKLLLIDEPTVGIDVGVKEELYKFIEALAAGGSTVLIVTSDLKELLRVSHRIIVMRKGKIFKEFNTGSVTQENVLEAASGIEKECAADE